MGTGISLNYSNITPHFDFGIWKVSKAIQKSTNNKVCLWEVDYAKMKEKERNKKNRRHYIQFLMQALTAQQKFQHLNILKIYEVQSAAKKLGFASEEIETSLAKEKDFSRDELIYIAQQLASTMRHVHDMLHLAFMGICPENVFLNSHFTLKLGLFIHTAPFLQELAQISDPFIPWSPYSIFHIPATFSAPEVVAGGTITSRSDVYMYALLCIFIFTGQKPTTSESVVKVDETTPFELLQSVPPEFASLLRNCLNHDPSSRPNFDQITSADTFSSIVSNIFQYIENIRDKDLKDMYTFFVGLKNTINVFSDRIIRKKFMPIFIFYLQKDMRFANGLVPLFFKCFNKYKPQEFIAEVLRPIKSVLVQKDNPKITLMLLDYLGTLLNRLPAEYFDELVFPIAFAALQSNDANVLMAVLDQFPNLLDAMSINLIRTEAIPLLMKIAENNQIPDIINSVIKLCILAMNKTGPEFIAQSCFLPLGRMWRKSQWPKLAESLADLVELCDVPAEQLFTSTLQMAIQIVAVPKVASATQARMILFIQDSLQKINKEHHLSKADYEEARNQKAQKPAFPTTKLKDLLDEEEEEDDDDEQNDNLPISSIPSFSSIHSNQDSSSNLQKPQPANDSSASFQTLQQQSQQQSSQTIHFNFTPSNDSTQNSNFNNQPQGQHNRRGNRNSAKPFTTFQQDQSQQQQQQQQLQFASGTQSAPNLTLQQQSSYSNSFDMFQNNGSNQIQNDSKQYQFDSFQKQETPPAQQQNSNPFINAPSNANQPQQFSNNSFDLFNSQQTNFQQQQYAYQYPQQSGPAQPQSSYQSPINTKPKNDFDAFDFE